MTTTWKAISHNKMGRTLMLLISLILFTGKALGAEYSFWWPMGFLIAEILTASIEGKK